MHKNIKTEDTNIIEVCCTSIILFIFTSDIFLYNIFVTYTVDEIGTKKTHLVEYVTLIIHSK